MDNEKYGLKLSSENGTTILEVGPHVVAEMQGFGAGIGAVASTWAQAEVNLYCLFAVLMNTTPELAEKALNKQVTAKRATDEARRIATENLIGQELQDVDEALGLLDRVRLLRNRVQHDTWGRKPTDRERLYRVHRDQYLAFALKLLDVHRLASTTEEGDTIKDAMNFVGEISEGFSVPDLHKIAEDIDAVSKLMLKTMLAVRTRQLRGGSQV